jgi:hypothetical protein
LAGAAVLGGAAVFAGAAGTAGAAAPDGLAVLGDADGFVGDAGFTGDAEAEEDRDEKGEREAEAEADAEADGLGEPPRAPVLPVSLGAAAVCTRSPPAVCVAPPSRNCSRPGTAPVVTATVPRTTARDTPSRVARTGRLSLVRRPGLPEGSPFAGVPSSDPGSPGTGSSSRANRYASALAVASTNGYG